ncbi:MAG: hydrogenase nickel incorporation protein HypB [Thiobacillaceae bacterium]
MCNVCGCGQGETRIEGELPAEHAHAHTHEHPHDHAHAHGHLHRHADGTVHSHPHAGDHLHYGLGPAHAHAPGLSQARMLSIEQDILARNNAYAEANRRWLAERGVLALNLVSSPGSGKTTLLVKTIEALRGRVPLAVIEGDQQTSLDAERIRATGVRAIQVNTGKGCHLDAHMVGHALERLEPAEDGLLLIENVGNLVCPAGFDLGEARKVVILSVTEGEDKPLKYPDMFHAADLMLINKIDLLPYVAFDVERCIEYARRVKPQLQVLKLSATTGEGLAGWIDWIEVGLARARAARDDRRSWSGTHRAHAGITPTAMNGPSPPSPLPLTGEGSFASRSRDYGAELDALERRIAELEARLAAKG